MKKKVAFGNLKIHTQIALHVLYEIYIKPHNDGYWHWGMHTKIEGISQW